MIFPVILCGGSGTRLWPLSRSSYPKQFVQFEKNRTLFKDTVNRAKKIKNSSEPIIICNDAHRFYAKANLLECGVDGTIIVEPVAKKYRSRHCFRRFVCRAIGCQFGSGRNAL